MNESIKRIWIFFFLILFCNSVFAYGYNPDNSYYFAEKEISSDGVVFDRGNGCMSKELSEKEVNALWGEILTKGFSADLLDSDQEANTNRENLDKNNLIVADADAKSGDVGAKMQVPSQQINPLEVPMLIGKTCYGSYDFGLNLNETLRVGRCDLDSNTSDCYLSMPGQYRQNNLSASNVGGFFKEVKVVGKDLISGIKETVIKNEEDEIPGKENMGPFSDLSSRELSKIEQTMLANDANTINTETWDAVSDEVLVNSSLTQNFAATMQTTCSGENCYINTYSLFDKMFNQYFSADMVYSSVSPFLFNGAARIFNVPGVKNAVLKPINTLKDKGLIKDGGFLDTLTKDPALFVKDPFGRISQSIKASKYANADVDRFVEFNLAHNEIMGRDIAHYNMKGFTDNMFDSVQDGIGATSKFNKEMILDGTKKLSAAQRRVATDVAQEYADKLYSSSALLKSKLANPITSDAINIYKKGIANGANINEILSNLTEEQYKALDDYVYTATKLSKSLEIAMDGKFKWKDSLFDTATINNKVAKVYDNGVEREIKIENYKSLDGGSNALYKKEILQDGSVKIDTKVYGDEFKLFEYDRVNQVSQIKGAGKSVVTENMKVPLAGGEVNRQRLKAVYKDLDKSGAIKIYDAAGLTPFQKNTTAFVSFTDSVSGPQTISIHDYFTNSYTPLPGTIELYPKGYNTILIDDVEIFDTVLGKKVKIKDAINPNTGKPYGPGYFDLDPLEVAAPVLIPPSSGSTVVKKIDDTANRFSDVLKTMSHKEWVSGKGRDAINQLMRNYNGGSYQRFLTQNLLVFGLNFAYWEVKSGGATIFGDTIGMTRWSMYQLPETYTALKIKHKENGEIYKDAYLDFFANTGSDQGDLFMKYLNSMLFWSVNVTSKVVEGVGADWSTSVVDFLNARLQGQIRRSETDDIVLITNNISSGCNNQFCNFTIGANYIDQNTMNASLSAIELEELEKENKDAKENTEDADAKENTEDADAKENTEDADAKENTEDKGLLDFITKNKNTPKLKSQVDYKSISVDTVTSDGIKTNNYLLENTSEKNLKVGQTLISFSHHTDYDGTMAGQSTEKAIDLIESREKEETCGQKVTNLTFLGAPIGSVIPKSFRNHRFVVGSMIAQKFAYLVLPGSGYFNSFIGPAIVSDIPMQTMIMPEIHGCIDDEEGLYAHFFVSAQEEERQNKDSKNKVGEAIIDGTKKVEEVVSKVTSGTELEKGVKAGSDKVKEYVEENIIEDPIVQATFTTGGGTNTAVKGQLFFIEIGPKTKCMASGYNDKGVEVLKDKDTNIDVTIDKEKGILTVTDENGTRTVIGEGSKDFVRLIGDNLGIPAKVIPRSLTYIPLPNNTEPLFEIDAHGNLTVKNSEFFDCLRAGYEAQTGLTMSSTSKNLTPYLGIVKLTNDINPIGAYTSSFLGNSIISQGAGLPRLIANGNTSKLTVLGNRSTTIGPIDGKENRTGKNISVQFEFGQLVYSEEAKAYIMWVETTTETSGNDIASMKAEVTKTKAINGCENEEIGINFSTSPVKDNDQAAANTEKLNKALEKVGPFQMFDTKTKTFIFYVSDPPECEQRLKIIDKETGEIYDAKISSFEQTPNGISVKTDDGQTHNLEFSAEDGVPRLTYNGEKDTLTSAQGKNGSFWYDPETGNWYTTNGNLIPLNDAFRDGVSFGVDGNGKVTGTPGTNVFNIGSAGSGKGSGGFNIPLTPESTVMIILYITVILSGFVLIYMDRKKRK